MGQIACMHSPFTIMHCQSGTENAKVGEGIARASQSSWKPRPALKGVSSTASDDALANNCGPWTPSYLQFFHEIHCS